MSTLDYQQTWIKILEPAIGACLVWNLYVFMTHPTTGSSNRDAVIR